MGNITDRPKAPSPQVIYVPQPVYSAGGTTTPSPGANENSANEEKIPTVAEQREKNLLGRNRSRLGTILTGFRGILTPLVSDDQRKTLLGE